MKSLLISIIAVIVFATSAFAQNGNQHHIFAASDMITEVTLNLDGHVEIRKTEGSRILVETSIETNLPNANMIKILINGGRYDISKQEGLAEHQLILTSKERKNVLMVQGTECKEITTHIVYVPEGIKVTNQDDLVALND